MQPSDTAKTVRVYPVALAEHFNYTGYLTHGFLVSHAKAYRGGILNRHFIFEKIKPIVFADVEPLLQRLSSDGIPTIFLLSSYVWNHELNIEFALAAKRMLPDSLAIIGGPNIPRAEKPCAALMNRFHCIDVAVRGEGEETLAEILLAVTEQMNNGVSLRWTDFSEVPGLTFKTRDLRLVRTMDRPRIKDLNVIPSPYLTGELEDLPSGGWTAVIETNRGCPFGCTFCDWGGATLSKIHKFDEQRILDEIEYVTKKGADTILITDANFGTFERDLTFAKKVVEMKQAYGKPHAIHYFLAKNSPERVAEIIRIFNNKGMIIDNIASLQSTDPVVLKNVGRSNIKESSYLKLIDAYNELGVQPATDFLIGLPGQNLDSFKKDLQFGFDRNILARSFLVSVLPNSPISDPDYQEKFDIKVDDNNFVKSTYSFTEEERDRMLTLRLAYKFFVDIGIIKNLLLYFQFEHGIKAMDFIVVLMSVAEDKKDGYPWIRWVFEKILRYEEHLGPISMSWSRKQGKIFNNFEDFLKELIAIAKESFGAKFSREEIEAVCAFQSFLQPHQNRQVFEKIRFPYDFLAYFEQFQKGIAVLSDGSAAGQKPLRLFQRSALFTLPDQPRLRTCSLAFSEPRQIEEPWLMQVAPA